MGHPYNLYHEPLTPFVASFVGQGYFIRGQLLSPDTVQTELGVIRGNRAYSLPSGSAVTSCCARTTWCTRRRAS